MEPWKKPENAIVIDAYELNEIDWSDMLSDKRIAGFISKASDGLPESYSCKGDHNGSRNSSVSKMQRPGWTGSKGRWNSSVSRRKARAASVQTFG